MPLHLVTPIDRAQDARADSDSLDLPVKGWRSHAADLCYIVLRGSTFKVSARHFPLPIRTARSRTSKWPRVFSVRCGQPTHRAGR